MSGDEMSLNQKLIHDECSAAIRRGCDAHSLNLCLLKAGQVTDIRKVIA